jgi:hypothetical protein
MGFCGAVAEPAEQRAQDLDFIIVIVSAASPGVGGSDKGPAFSAASARLQAAAFRATHGCSSLGALGAATSGDQA